MRQALFLAALFFAFSICSRAQAAEQPKCVVLAHGWDGWTNDWQLGPAEWNTFRPMLESAGYQVYVPSLGNENVANASIIKSTVDSISSTCGEIDIVAHSMGGLSARYYLKNLGGAARVSAYVALDTPQYGGIKALWMNWQMLPGSQFLAALHTPDATPGTLPYVQLTFDYPQLLPGVYYKALSGDGMTHRNLVTNPDVLALVMRNLAGDFSGLAVNP